MTNVSYFSKANSSDVLDRSRIRTEWKEAELKSGWECAGISAAVPSTVAAVTYAVHCLFLIPF